MSPIDSNLSLLRHAGRLSRAEARRMSAGDPGVYSLDLAFDGLTETRREQLAAAMNLTIGVPDPAERVGDGRLHARALVNGVGLQAAAASMIGQIAGIFRDAEIDLAEFIDADLDLTVTPDLDSVPARWPKGVRGALARKTARAAHGLSVATAEVFDLSVQQQHGDRSYFVDGTLTGVIGPQAARVSEQAALVFGQRAGIRDDEIAFTVTCDVVGTPLGALLLVVRRLGEMLAAAPAGAALRLSTLPVD